MKIAVFTDIHGNLPALQAALSAVREEGCEAIYHTGDAISVGPFPQETLDLLLAEPGIHCLLGNHEIWLLEPAWMHAQGAENMLWSYSQIHPEQKRDVSTWPARITETFGSTRVEFLHFALDRTGNQSAASRHLSPVEALEPLFKGDDVDLVFFGHTHSFLDVQAQRRYVNPGSLGCQPEPVACFTIAQFDEAGYKLEHRRVPYDDQPLFAAFEQRRVPDRQLIYKSFFKGRFTAN